MRIFRLSQSEEFAYHATDVKPDIILQQGLSKLSRGHTEFDVIDNIERYLPSNRVYVSKNIREFPGKYHYKVNISGLLKYPDFGSLPDHEAYMDEESCWWKDRSIDSDLPPLLKAAIMRNGFEINYSDISGEDTWSWFGTCVFEGPIDISRIVDVIVDGDIPNDLTKTAQLAYDGSYDVAGYILDNHGVHSTNGFTHKQWISEKFNLTRRQENAFSDFKRKIQFLKEHSIYEVVMDRKNKKIYIRHYQGAMPLPSYSQMKMLKDWAIENGYDENILFDRNAYAKSFKIIKKAQISDDLQGYILDKNGIYSTGIMPHHSWVAENAKKWPHNPKELRNHLEFIKKNSIFELVMDEKYKTIYVRPNGRRRPSPSQIKMLKDWAIENGYDENILFDGNVYF
jgi:hypothetical protein